MADENLKNKIAELEEELRITKVNKRTEMSVGLLKARIARLKEELENKLSKKVGSKIGFAVKKEGDATICFLGKPSVGKSTILSKITNKKSKIGAYEFTTLDVVPGLLNFNFTNLQILDLPGIIDKASENRGFGKKILSCVRVCDLVVLVVDAKNLFKDFEMLLNETKNANILLNKKKPFIEVKKMMKGGIKISLNNSRKTLPKEFIKEVLQNNKFTNYEVLIHEKNLSLQDFVDACYSNIEYKKGVVCINKIDMVDEKKFNLELKLFQKKFPKFDTIKISAENETNLEDLKLFLWQNLNFIWLYLKQYKREVDFSTPLVIKKNDTIKIVCEKLHKDFLGKFKFAKVKGKSVKFDFQQVGLEHIVQDKDIVEIFLN